jgi:catechol 2,3-dioxygenase-like lactoylglutathione lyase family enzyme
MISYDGITHTTLPVDDLERAERFYIGLLGADLRRRLDRETFLRLQPDRVAEADADNSPLHLEIGFGDAHELHLFLQRRFVPSAPVPHPHTAFATTSEVLDAVHERLRAARVPVDGPRRLGPPGHASLYFVDPFGHLLELVTLRYARPIPFGPPDVHALGRAFETMRDEA